MRNVIKNIFLHGDLSETSYRNIFEDKFQKVCENKTLRKFESLEFLRATNRGAGCGVQIS